MTIGFFQEKIGSFNQKFYLEFQKWVAFRNFGTLVAAFENQKDRNTFPSKNLVPLSDPPPEAELVEFRL